ncbi:MAG TPA: hypothetical protein VEX64_04445 [Pyrinomonadaceae bacterium]|nr:hypothetical protein [Pyrinomonadaceae bacterium]
MPELNYQTNTSVAARRVELFKKLLAQSNAPSGNILQDILDKTERRNWFLCEFSQDGKN